MGEREGQEKGEERREVKEENGRSQRMGVERCEGGKRAEGEKGGLC